MILLWNLYCWSCKFLVIFVYYGFAFSHLKKILPKEQKMQKIKEWSLWQLWQNGMVKSFKRRRRIAYRIEILQWFWVREVSYLQIFCYTDISWGMLPPLSPCLLKLLINLTICQIFFWFTIAMFMELGTYKEYHEVTILVSLNFIDVTNIILFLAVWVNIRFGAMEVKFGLTYFPNCKISFIVET